MAHCFSPLTLYYVLCVCVCAHLCVCEWDSATSGCPCVRWCPLLNLHLHLQWWCLGAGTNGLECRLPLPGLNWATSWEGSGGGTEETHSDVTTVHGHSRCRAASSSTPLPALPVMVQPPSFAFGCGNTSCSLHAWSVCLPASLQPTPSHLTWKPRCYRSVSLQWYRTLKHRNPTTAKLVLRKQNIQWLALERWCVSASPSWPLVVPLPWRRGSSITCRNVESGVGSWVRSLYSVL